MELESLKPIPGARHRRKRLGSGPGSGTGKTCGKGHKGQMARKGGKHKVGFEGGQMRLVRRIPKRGFNNFTRKEIAPVNLTSLSIFPDGTEVTNALLRESGLVNGNWDGIKILGRGEIDRKLTVKAYAFSGSARAKIEAAGGVCEVVDD
ncbi:MAG: large subunit ribosomal protein L15 [Candidatus Promineifilaceae bacterium]|jgi:large subunit ribosomal protein L15